MNHPNTIQLFIAMQTLSDERLFKHRKTIDRIRAFYRSKTELKRRMKQGA